MDKQYITLSDGQRLRIEVNWNVMCDFLDRTGQDYNDFAKNADDLTAKHLRLMAYCSAIEGERQDGKELGLSELDFGALCSIKTMSDFGPKFASMVSDEQKKRTVPQEEVRTRPVTSSIKRILGR